MTHTYARRTQAEAQEIARQRFKQSASKHLSVEMWEEMQSSALLTGGTPDESWIKTLGFQPTMQDYYQFEVYKPCDAQPYIEKWYVRILVPRSRSADEVLFQWNT